ncbi:MAG: 1-(5-phosphoribosyl)-5-[(5-phosphoribosylamino)methylideneamino] imidazole-4-carboxamide isomerase [Reichenbachiella sp.]
MKLVPSIAIKEGKVARIAQGDFSKIKYYDTDPVDLCHQFEDCGIETIHFVDLDGSKKGKIINYSVLEAIAGHTDVSINFTGGVHTDGDIVKVLECGADTVTCATMAVYNKELFVSWLMSYGREKIALGADSNQDKLRVGGWKKDEDIDLFEHIAYFYDRGLKYLKTSDISRMGLMEGPSLDLYKRIKDRFPDVYLFAAGGIRNIEDIYHLHQQGVNGVVIGKAFYEGLITLKDMKDFNMKA